MSADEMGTAHLLSAYKSLATSRGVDVRVVLDAVAAGDLRSVVAMPEVRRRHSKPRPLTVRQARVRLLERRWGPGELDGPEHSRPSVWAARLRLMARRWGPGELDGT